MIKKIVNGIFGVNTYLIIKGNECIIVDPGMDIASELIKQKYQVLAILITHGHVDHIGGIINFLDVPIYISGLDESKLYDSNTSLYKMLGLKTPYKKGDLNINLVEDKSIITIGEFVFQVILTPGHTNGSVCYKYNDVLFSGDTLFKNSIGRTDFPTGNIFDMQNSLLKLAKLPNKIKVYPGHDELTSIKDEKKNNPYLKKS